MGRSSIRCVAAAVGVAAVVHGAGLGGAAAFAQAGGAAAPHVHDDALMPCALCSEGKIQLHRFMRQVDPASVLTPAVVGGDRDQPFVTPRGMGGDDPALVGNTDVLDYDLTLDVNPTSRVLTGTNIITVRTLAAGVTFMDLELHQNFNVTAAQVNGVNATISRPNASVPKILRVTFPAGAGVVNANQTFTVRIAYNGVPVSGGFGSIVFTTQNNQPVVSTLSQTRFAHTWWPVKENNADKATGTMRISVPVPLSVASNGVLQSETTADGRTQFTYRTNYRTPPYLFAFSTTQYGRFSDTWSYTPVAGSPFGSGPVSMPLQFMIYSGSDTTANRNAMRNVGPMLTAFSNVYGLYPFWQEKYGLYQFAFGGGMEHQTMSGQGGSNPWAQSLSAHELGHQWWGDMITCTTWADIWLNEGLATYSEAIWVENRPASFGVNGTPGLLLAMNNRRPSSLTGTVYVYDTENENLIFNFNNSYLKGAWVFHMLRRVMGDANFFAALQAYRLQYQFKTADTAQFRAICENIHGSSLAAFFEQWVMLPGAPAYSWATGEVSVPLAGGGVQRYAEIYLTQTQASPAANVFVMPVELNATVGSGTQILKVQNNLRQQHFLVPIGGALGTVNLDPDNWILNTGKTAVSMPASGPRVVAVNPAAGSSTVVGSISGVSASFHQGMNVASLAGGVQLRRNGLVVNGVSVSYNGALQQVTIAASEPLAPGVYEVSIGGVTGSNGLLLDGEGTLLPSGNGQPGGNFVSTFTIAACNASDVGRGGGGEGGEGALDNNDFIVFINWFFASDVRADVGSEGGATGSDGVFDNNDFIVFIDGFFGGGC
jgi:hypothetical protein